MDRLLDAGTTGPLYLKIPEIATTVVTAIQYGANRFHRYDLHAYVVMANHVHLLITPNVTAAKWLGPLKGYTAHEANRLLNLQGQPFWQDESYDHLVRTPEEFTRVQKYIENNPVTAGLAQAPDQFPWSSATQRI
jgi:REP element-mobilizing transposase RayT